MRRYIIFGIGGVIISMVLILCLLQRVGIVSFWHKSPTFVTEQVIIDAYIQEIQTIMAQKENVHEALLAVRVPEELRDVHLHAVLTIGSGKDTSMISEQDIASLLQTLIDNAQSL